MNYLYIITYMLAILWLYSLMTWHLHLLEQQKTQRLKARELARWEWSLEQRESHLQKQGL